MLTWLKIVCAVDFSQSARSALEHAAELSRRFDAELVLVHVRTAPARLEAIDFLPPDVTQADEEEAGRKLSEWAREAERISERSVRVAVPIGTPAEEIARLARIEKADLVVVGTHGRRGVRRAVLGSVAESVVRHAPCPVLVARPGEDWGD